MLDFPERNKVYDPAEWLDTDGLENDLIHARDILERSVDLSIAAFRELHEFARDKGIRLGCNVESVSLRKVEIEASIVMVDRVAQIMGRKD